VEEENLVDFGDCTMGMLVPSFSLRLGTVILRFAILVYGGGFVRCLI